MKVTQSDLRRSAAEGIISDAQATRLWDFLSAPDDTRPRFSGVHVAYYFGALIVISAMTWFATEAFSRFHGIGLASVSAVYTICLTVFGGRLIANKMTYIPGGLLLTISVFLFPLLVFGVQSHFGLWVYKNPGNYNDYYTWVKSGWFFMELVTIAAAVIYLFLFRFPFLTFPLSFTIWFLSMDVTPIIFGDNQFTWHERKVVSVVFGVLMLICAFIVDKRTKRDFAFWIYLFGLIAFWTGLTLMGSDSELGKFFYFLINIGLVLCSVLLERRTFLVFGALGVYSYLFHLSRVVFKDSMMFPVALSALGLLVIWSGVAYNKHKRKIEEAVGKFIPDAVWRVMPPRRG